MTNYEESFIKAGERTASFNLEVPPFRIENSKRYLKPPLDFQKIINATFAKRLTLEDLFAKCIYIHSSLLPTISKVIGTDAVFTIGNVSSNGQLLFPEFNDSAIEKLIKENSINNTVYDFHTWITLPSLEILDFTLSTTYGKVKNMPDMYGAIISTHISEVKELVYTPILIGQGLFSALGWKMS